MRIVCVPPHFEPDVAPTGVVWTRIVRELVARGHEVEVVTSLPWYREHRVEERYEGRTVRYEDTPWGRITRIDPFASADKTNIVRRALAFGRFSAAAAALGARGPRVDGVIAVSPPLTLALTGWAIAKVRKAPLVFNLQDIFPDVAIELGTFTSPRIIAATRRLERLCYRISDGITVLSDDLKHNVMAKGVPLDKIRVIPNFVETDRITPQAKENEYRREFGLTGKTVVMYAGNVGLSQPLDLVIDAAAALAHEESVVFVINGQGATRETLERRARGMSNIRFMDMQPLERLPEVLAAADIHLVPLKRGLGASSVPSKTYSILAAGRPFVASVDEGTEIARLATSSGAGLAVPPEDAEALTKALLGLIERPEQTDAMGAAGRSFIEAWASPAAIAASYEDFLLSLRR